MTTPNHTSPAGRLMVEPGLDPPEDEPEPCETCKGEGCIDCEQHRHEWDGAVVDEQDYAVGGHGLDR